MIAGAGELIPISHRTRRRTDQSLNQSESTIVSAPAPITDNFARNTSRSSLYTLPPIPMTFFALEEHFLPAVGSEIGRSVMVTIYDPVQALFSTTAKVSPYH